MAAVDRPADQGRCALTLVSGKTVREKQKKTQQQQQANSVRAIVQSPCGGHLLEAHRFTIGADDKETCYKQQIRASPVHKYIRGDG